MIGEIGLDTALFGTAARLCSGPKCCPVRCNRATMKPTGRPAKATLTSEPRWARWAPGRPGPTRSSANATAASPNGCPRPKSPLRANGRSSSLSPTCSPTRCCLRRPGADYYEKLVNKERRMSKLVREQGALGRRVAVTTAAWPARRGPPTTSGLPPGARLRRTPLPDWTTALYFTVVIFRTGRRRRRIHGPATVLVRCGVHRQ